MTSLLSKEQYLANCYDGYKLNLNMIIETIFSQEIVAISMKFWYYETMSVVDRCLWSVYKKSQIIIFCWLQRERRLNCAIILDINMANPV